VTDRTTLEVYAARAEDYAKRTRKAAAKDPLLLAFIATLPSGAKVLDLGCGPGGAAAAMAAAGLQVTAIDAVPQMVALAQQHKGVSARHGTFDSIAETDVYDGIWANFSLLHAPRADLPDHLARLHCALKPGGRFHIAVKAGRGENRDALGRLYTYYTDAELTGLLEAAGFTVTDHAAGGDLGLDDTYADWIALGANG
jgi:SAM-dependent methyltransferase